jgi:hypothetical protein
VTVQAMVVSPVGTPGVWPFADDTGDLAARCPAHLRTVPGSCVIGRASALPGTDSSRTHVLPR